MIPRLIGVLSAALLACFGLVATASASSNPSNHGWITFQAAEHAAYGLNAAQTQWAFNSAAPGTGVTCDASQSLTNACITDNITGQNILRFTSEATFAADVGKINKSVFKYVLYDIEDGNGTPLNEAKQPRQFMSSFNQVAANNGFIPVITPARDLGNVALDCAKHSGENLDAWSLRCTLWGHAAVNMPTGGIVVIQSQVDTPNLTAFKNLVSGGLSEIAQHPAATGWDEISTTYGTDAQRVTALESEPSVGGSYFSYSTGLAGNAITDWADLQAANW